MVAVICVNGYLILMVWGLGSKKQQEGRNDTNKLILREEIYSLHTILSPPLPLSLPFSSSLSFLSLSPSALSHNLC